MALIDQNMNKALWDAAGQGVAASNTEAQAAQAAQLKQAADVERRQRNAQALMQHLLGAQSRRSYDPESGQIGAAPDYSAKLLAQQDRNDAQLRQETQAVQGEFKKLGGKQLEQSAAIDTMLNQLNDNNVQTMGQVRAGLARTLGGEVGVMTDQDINRQLPRTLREDVVGLAAYINPKWGESPLEKGQLDQLRARLIEKKAAIEASRQRAVEELKTRSQYLAPSLTKTGGVDKVLSGLGAATNIQRPDGQQSQQPLTFEQFKQLKKQGKI